MQHDKHGRHSTDPTPECGKRPDSVVYSYKEFTYLSGYVSALNLNPSMPFNNSIWPF